ncbi:MAG: peptidylprolyl isomerase [Planctomycetota bacterium]|jgi:parvulin-like peptidyl-prolyl isomerase
MTLYVNGEQVEHALIDDEIQRLRPSYEHAFADVDEDARERQLVEWSRENVIEAVLFRQEAQKQFGDIDDAVIGQALDHLLAQENETGPVHQRMSAGAEEQAKLRAEIADQYRKEQLTQKITGDISEPTDKAIRKYYDQNIDRFTVPEMVHAAHIVKHPSRETSPEDLQKDMEQILEQLNSGAAFEELASQNSDCSDNAGDLGFFARGQMVPAFEAVVFNLEPGQCSGIFQSEFGLHIAKVYEKRPSIPCPLEQVREVIVRDLEQQAREKAIENFLDTQKATSAIEER